MKLRIRWMLLLLALALLVLGAACSSGDDDDDSGGDDDVTDDDADDDADDDTTVEWIDVCYFYDTDNSVATGYESFLEDRGFTVEVYEISTLDTKAEVTYCRVFMIDNNAGNSSWTTARRQKIYDSERPIIGLGAGVAVMDEAGSYISYTNSWMVSDDSFSPSDDYLNHPLFHAPNDLGFTTHDPVQIYSGGSDDVYELLETGNQAGVEYIGYFTPKGPSPHYSIAVENMYYGLWGFGAVAPSGFTAVGQDLFENFVKYLIAGGEKSAFVDFNDYTLGTLGSPWEINAGGASTATVVTPLDERESYYLQIDGGDTLDVDYLIAQLPLTGTSGLVRTDLDIYSEPDANWGFGLMKATDRIAYVFEGDAGALTAWDYDAGAVIDCNYSVNDYEWFTLSMIVNVAFTGPKFTILVNGESTDCTDIKAAGAFQATSLFLADWSDAGYGGMVDYDNLHVYPFYE